MNINYLVLVANSLRKIYQLKKKLSYVHYRDKIETQEAVITQIECEWQNEWKLITTGVENRMLVRWITTLYVIPMIENCIILALLILILTSFDIHPLGCFFNIDIHYEELTKAVTLRFSKAVHNYQKVAVVSAVIICVFWMCLKWIQSSMLPDAYQISSVSTDDQSYLHLYSEEEEAVVDLEKLDGNTLPNTEKLDIPKKDCSELDITSPYIEIRSSLWNQQEGDVDE